MTYLGLVHDHERGEREFEAALHGRTLQSPSAASVAGGRNARARRDMTDRIRARARGRGGR